MHFKWDLLVGKDDASFRKDPSAPVRCVVVFFVLKESHSKTLLTCLQNLFFYFIFLFHFYFLLFDVLQRGEFVRRGNTSLESKIKTLQQLCCALF